MKIAEFASPLYHQFDDRRLTVLDKPTVLVKTKDGKISYLDWLKREAQRLSKHDVPSRIFRNHSGMIALFRLV